MLTPGILNCMPKVIHRGPLDRLKVGEPTGRNWRSINELHDRLEEALLPDQTLREAVAELRAKLLDIPKAGSLQHYVKTKSWSPGDRVVVYPTDELVTAGLLDEETETVLKAPAGIYCCQKSSAPVPIDPEADPVVYRYNAPKWPTETAGDLEATNTYWWLESLYVVTDVKCVDGEAVDFYVNAQPVLEQS